MKKILFCFVVLISVASFGQQKFQNLKGSKPMKVQFLGKSPKLTAIKPIPSRKKASESDVYIVPNKFTKTGLLKKGPNSAPDPVMQKTTSQQFSSGAGQVLQGFDGASNDDNADVNGIRVTPPDTQGDVGPNHYIQMINSLTTIFDKSGNILFGPVPNSVFFQDLDPRLAGTNDGDPVVLYDQFADRWIISQFAVGAGAPFAMLIAVSATSDPLGEYNQYAIDYGDDFPDYPKLGIWNDALYISTRDFPTGGGFQFSLVAVNRADINAGVETEAQRFVIDNLGFDGILPADADGTMPPPDGEPHYSLFLGAGNEMNLISTTIDFENPANSTLEFGTVPVAPYSFFNTSVPQANGQSLDVLPFFLMYRLQYLNFGTHASLLTNHSVQEVAGGPFGIRWYEFRDTGAEPWEVFQQGTYIPDDGLNRWMGSVAMNENGDIALAYSVSSATLAPSIRFAGQSASESGTGILNIPETSIFEGTFFSSGPQTRWGDYSMMSIDPVDQDFWFTTEYIADDSGNFGWATYISEMTFGDPPTAICQDITVELDAEIGSVSITPEQIDNGSIGPDGGEVTLSLDIDTFDCSAIGENTVTLTATSPDGISSSCTAVVTVNVIDTEAPVAVCQDILVELIDESVEITADQIDGGSTDNCAIASLEVDQSVFTELGTFTVTLTVTDFAGFTDTCEATVTVAEGAEILVDPLSINTAVDVETVSPPIATETLTITNNGGVPLDFTTEVGVTQISSEDTANALANLDRSIYGAGGYSSAPGKLKATKSKIQENSLQNEPLASSVQVLDSLFLDSGFDAPGSFVGFGPGGPGTSAGIRFIAPEGGFKLNAVRNAYRTEDFGSADILLQVYAGGATPDLGTLLTEQLITNESVDGVVTATILDAPQQFGAGEVFWIVHNYPQGIDFPQGFDDTLPATNSEDYVVSSDGGVTFTNQAGFAFFTRALNVLGGFISLSPGSGTVNPGESFEVEVTFDAADLGNGVYETPILVSSNDANNPEVTVETTFTVSGVQTPEIEVTPESLEAAVDVQVDTPPVAEETVTITNNGGALLEFDIAAGSATFTAPGPDEALATLDRSIYNNSNKQFSKADFKSVKAVEKKSGLKVKKLGDSGLGKSELANSAQVIDSLFYDTGIDFPSSFGGLDNGTALSAGVLFVVDSEEFTLTSVRNAYTTETVQGANILLQIYAGGVTPDQGTLLYEQVFTGDSETGVFALETLDSPLTFSQGDSFWVVHSYPEGINFPQGQDDGVVNTVPGVYSFSSDGGQTFTLLDGFAFLTRALSEEGGDDSFITLSPQNGFVEPGESVEVTVAFNGANLTNGTYDSDLTITSNDPVTPTVTVPTSFVVSGQTAEIEVSDELLLFNDVFVGNSAERSLIISNPGLGELTISSITSDNAEFSATPSSATIAAGGELEVLVSYAPENVGSSNGILTITSDATDASSVEVVVNGVGVEGPTAVLDPLENFVTLPQGESNTVDLTLSNTGGSPLIYSFPEFTTAAAIANGAELFKAELIDFPNFSAVQAKGFEDTRKGAPTPFSMGTDVVFGYTWIDSDEDGGPVPNFIDIIPFGATDITEFLVEGVFADGTAEITLPSPFPFYGEIYESLFINANGFVAFEPPSGATFVNSQIPVDNGINNIIAPFWNDLEPGTGDGGTVHVAAFGNAVIVQWTDAPGFLTTGTVTFQVILFPDGTIEVQYDDVSTASFLATATVGIENTGGTDGAQVAFNTDFVKDDFALRFIPPLVPGANFITAATPVSGVLGVGQQETITVTVDSQDLNLGTFLDALVLSSNSVNLESSTAAFELTVVEPAPELTFTLVNADTDEIVGPLVDGAVIDLDDFPTGTNFNVIADIGDSATESVAFDFNGAVRTENVAPYTLGGDTDGGTDFLPVIFPEGTNTLSAIGYSLDGANGEALISNAITFEVTPQTPATDFSGAVTGFTLVNSDTDEIIGGIVDGAVINLSDYPEGTSFNVIAETEDPLIESVVFGFNGSETFKTENVSPYTLGGDSNNGTNFLPFTLPVGVSTLIATPFSKDRGDGEVGIANAISFEVVEQVEAASLRIFPNPGSGIVSVSFEDGTKMRLTGTLYNFYGQAVYSNINFDLESNTNVSLDISSLYKGVYMLEFKDSKGALISQEKLVKQ